MRGAKRLRKPKKRETRREIASPSRKGAGLDLAIPLLDLFREEFFVALGQALEWTDDDAHDFWRDLELYEKLAGREARRAPSRAARAASTGPFVDRVALLLDPSLMDQARRAAAKFHLELDAAADRVLRRVFSRRRTN